MTNLTDTIDGTLRLLDRYKAAHTEATGRAGVLPSLLERCQAEVEKIQSMPAEPVRTIHHFASTGGTIITKCLAAMPNVHVLSEVDPLSTMQLNREQPAFAPTDLLRLMSYSARGLSHGDFVEVFLAGVRKLRELLTRRGERLLIRDHAHSYYCTQNFGSDRPVLKTVLSRSERIRSIVTVRDPIDSFLSLRANGWIDFAPATPEEYARRYTTFIDEIGDVPLFRYEDFIQAPDSEVERMCEALDLPFAPGFSEYMDLFGLTGNSGRSGRVIQERPRRLIPDDVAVEVADSPLLANLRQKLGYAQEIAKGE